MSERSTKFCQELWHKLGLYVDDLRDKGLSDRTIQHRLEQMEACGISCEGWKKRIQHRDTCTHIGVKPTELTQSETRKFQQLSNRDKKRVLQTFTDLQKINENAKPKRSLFKEAVKRVDPLILTSKRVAAPHTPTSEPALETHAPAISSKSLLSPTAGDTQPPTLITRVEDGKHGTTSISIDPSRLFPFDDCLCRKCEREYCPMREAYQQRMAAVYAQ